MSFKARDIFYCWSKQQSEYLSFCTWMMQDRTRKTLQLHHELCNTVITRFHSGMSYSKLFGSYLHALVVHAPQQLEIISLLCVNTENQERLFEQARRSATAASNRHPVLRTGTCQHTLLEGLCLLKNICESTPLARMKWTSLRYLVIFLHYLWLIRPRPLPVKGRGVIQLRHVNKLNV